VLSFKFFLAVSQAFLSADFSAAVAFAPAALHLSLDPASFVRPAVFPLAVFKSLTS
jgi:hypothetical protein